MSDSRCISCMRVFDGSVASVCPHCGYDQNTEKKESFHLDPGTYLENRYYIGRVIGSGGFGITYVAWDTVLDKKVAIKEYFPSEFATRMLGTTEVCAYDGEKSYQFEAGLKSFVDEALRLAKLNQLDSIVHIYDSFVDNCTAYIIMEYVEGQTLKEILNQRGPIPYSEVIDIVVPVLNALEKVHAEGIIHRDIAPDNIKVNGDTVTLLDFGAARNATTVHSKSLSVIVKPGYAPEEQYRSHGNQGPWTDVYAMAAVMYHMITGKLPEESVERNVKDELKTPTELGFTLPVPVENAIMNALNVKAEYRIQSAKEFADALTGAIEVERVVVKQTKPDDGKLSKKAKIISSVVAGIAVILIAVIIATSTTIRSYSFVGKNFPNLVGADEMQVETLLKDVGLGADNYQVVGILKNVDGDAGTIVWQDIEPGVKLSEEDENLIVQLKMAEAEVVEEDKSSDTAVMPNLSAMTKAEAQTALEKAGFTSYSFETKTDNSFKEGLVCDQSVKANKRIKKDKKITVYVAKNSTTTTQKTTNKTTAKKTTRGTENTTVKKTTAPKKTTTTKKRRSTTTAATKKHTSTATTTATTAAKVFVPNVAGKSSSSGQSTLRNAGFFVQTVAVRTTDESKDGVIQKTSPSGGSEAKKGSVVTVYVYHYEE